MSQNKIVNQWVILDLRVTEQRGGVSQNIVAEEFMNLRLARMLSRVTSEYVQDHLNVSLQGLDADNIVWKRTNGSFVICDS